MIRIRVVKRPGYMLLETNGHGSPMVCAGISAIMQTAALGLQSVAHHYPRSARVAKPRKRKK